MHRTVVLNQTFQPQSYLRILQTIIVRMLVNGYYCVFTFLPEVNQTIDTTDSKSAHCNSAVHCLSSNNQTDYPPRTAKTPEAS